AGDSGRLTSPTGSLHLARAQGGPLAHHARRGVRRPAAFCPVLALWLISTGCTPTGDRCRSSTPPASTPERQAARPWHPCAAGANRRRPRGGPRAACPPGSPAATGTSALGSA